MSINTYTPMPILDCMNEGIVTLPVVFVSEEVLERVADHPENVRCVETTTDGRIAYFLNDARTW